MSHGRWVAGHGNVYDESGNGNKEGVTMHWRPSLTTCVPLRKEWRKSIFSNPSRANEVIRTRCHSLGGARILLVDY